MNALDLEHAEALRDRLEELAADEDVARRRPDRRGREGVRRRRGHQVHAAPRRRRRRRRWGELGQRCGDPPRDDAEADDRGDQRLRARRRLRARACLRPPARVLDGQARPARGQPRDHPGLGRHAAPRADDDARLRQGALSSPAAWSAPTRRSRTASSTQCTRPRSSWTKVRELCDVLASKSPLALAVREGGARTWRSRATTAANLETEARLFSMLFATRGPEGGHGRLRREARARASPGASYRCPHGHAGVPDRGLRGGHEAATAEPDLGHASEGRRRERHARRSPGGSSGRG